MLRHWWKRLLQAKLRPAPRAERRRTASARPRFEVLEGREMPAVFAGVVGGQLRVTDTSAVDTVTLDHSGSTTFVNGVGFADAAITNGILITVGTGVGNFDTVNVLATVKPVTVDGQFDIGDFNVGKAGSVQGILAPVTLIDFNGDHTGGITIDDSADTVARNVVMNVANGVGTVVGLAPAVITYDASNMGGLDVKGGSGGNTFTIINTFNADHEDFSGIGATTVFSGVGKDTVNVLGAGGGVLNIKGQNGRDTVRIGNNGSSQNVLGSVAVDNAGSFTSLFVDDSANTASGDYLLTKDTFPFSETGIISQRNSPALFIEYNMRDVDFVSFSGGSGGNTIEIRDTFKNNTGQLTVVNTGAGKDTVSVSGTTGRLILNGQSGQDSVFVGGAFGTANIKGDVFVTNVGSRTNLTVSDFRLAIQFNGTGHAVTLDHTAGLAGTGTITGLAPALIQYVNNDVQSVNLTGSGFADSFFVRSTPVSNITIPVTINGSGGNDFFAIGSGGNTLDAIRGPVTVNGGSGTGDFLQVNDHGSTTGHFYGVTASTVTRQVGNAVTVNYSGMESLQVNKSTAPIVFNPDPFFPQAKDLALTKKLAAGQGATLTGRLVDGDAGDVLSLTVDWGDGSEPHESTPDRGPFAVNHAYAVAGTYTVRVIWTDSHGASNFRDLTVTVTDPPAVGGVVVGNGSAQRSMVKRLAVAFDQVVGFDPGAFELLRDGQPSGVTVHATPKVVGGHTVLVLTFSGPGVKGGSLADGNYQLVVHGAKVHNAQGQTTGGDHTEAFFRLFGDTDGDRDVDGADQAAMQAGLGKQAGQAGFRALLDYDGDGRVDAKDLARFNARAGTRLPG